MQAAEGKFNPHIHVEYEWSLRLEEMDESDDDLDDKVIFSTLITRCGEHPLENADETNVEVLNAELCL